MVVPAAAAAAAAAPIISVAPMVDVTTRHFRYLIRLMSRRTTLYTPMLVANRLADRKRRVALDMLRFRCPPPPPHPPRATTMATTTTHAMPPQPNEWTS